MATKGKNRQIARRKVRRVTKNMERDIGSRGSRKNIRFNYGAAVTSKRFPKSDEMEKE